MASAKPSTVKASHCLPTEIGCCNLIKDQLVGPAIARLGYVPIHETRAMTGEGDLNTSEEFGRSKRYLMWFCTFAVLLWLVQVPPDGAFESPMLGSSAKINIHELRIIVWLACLYSLVGFYRQVRNVQRYHNQVTYAPEFENLRTRLTKIATELASIDAKVSDIRQSIAVPSSSYFETRDIERELDNDLIEILTRVGSGNSANINDSDELFSEIRETIKKMIGRRASTSSNLLSTQFSYRMDNFIDRFPAMKDASISIIAIQRQFDKLSEDIRSDHRILFTWYDKYLSYLIFIVATVATSLGLAELSPQGLVHAVTALQGGWAALLSLIVLCTIAYIRRGERRPTR